jgi:hypothetical protein
MRGIRTFCIVEEHWHDSIGLEERFRNRCGERLERRHPTGRCRCPSQDDQAPERRSIFPETSEAQFAKRLLNLSRSIAR